MSDVNTTVIDLTYHGPDQSIQLLNIVFGLVSLVGLALSVALAIISTIVETEYRLFVLNLAIIDSLYGFGRCLSTALIIFPAYSGFLCKLDGFLFWYGKSASNMALFPTTVNRFIAVFVHDYFLKISTKRFALSLIGFVDALALMCLIPVCFIYGKLGRAAVGTDCSVEIDESHEEKFLFCVAIYFIAVIPISVLQFAMNGIIFCAVSRHRNLLEAARYEYKETREIVIALLFQTASPVIIQWPFIAVICFILFDPKVLISNWVYYGTKNLHGVGPLFDSIIIFMMVKPYRRVLLYWLSFLFPRFKRTKPTSAVTRVRPFMGTSADVSVIVDDKRSATMTHAALEMADFRTKPAANRIEAI